MGTAGAAVCVSVPRIMTEFLFCGVLAAHSAWLLRRARDKNTNEIVALKKIKLPSSFTSDGFPMTSVREINILLALQHPNIVDVTEVVANKRDVYMVMEYVQQDLKHFLEKYKTRLKIGEVLGARFDSHSIHLSLF
jgi:serine/threonine protein kinase